MAKNIVAPKTEKKVEVKEEVAPKPVTEEQVPVVEAPKVEKVSSIAAIEKIANDTLQGPEFSEITNGFRVTCVKGMIRFRKAFLASEASEDYDPGSITTLNEGGGRTSFAIVKY